MINQWQPLALAGGFLDLRPDPHLPVDRPGSGPRKVLLGSLLAAYDGPGGPADRPAPEGSSFRRCALLVWTYLPNYICAVLAVLPSKIIAHLGRKVSRARQLGSYHLVELIGRGGMGEVWKADHRLFARPGGDQADRRPRDAGGIGRMAEERFRREAEAAAGAPLAAYDPALRLRHHPRPPAVLRHGAARGHATSSRWSRATAPSRPPGWRCILRQACRSLAEAHAGGLVHRDIKPANLHLGRLGLEYDFVKVLDFGLVKRDARWLGSDVRLTAPESMSGTPAYMAPEMAAGEPVDGRADLYALGCVGYFLLTGSLVFEGENALQLVVKHIQAEPVPPSAATRPAAARGAGKGDPELSGEGSRRPAGGRDRAGGGARPRRRGRLDAERGPTTGGRPRSPRRRVTRAGRARRPPSFWRWPARRG